MSENDYICTENEYRVSLAEPKEYYVTFQFTDGEVAVFKDAKSLQEVFDRVNFTHKLEKENTDLRELLRECLNEIHELAEIQDNRSVTIYNFLSAELLTKITNAIGENK